MTTDVTTGGVAPANNTAQNTNQNVTDPANNSEVKPETNTTEKPVENPFKATKHKIKVDGQEAEIDYDELIRGYQTNKHALTKMQQASKDKQQAEDVIKLFKADPEQAAKVLGINAAEWAQKFMEREAELALKTPEERSRMKLLDELNALKAEKDTAEAARQSQELEQRTNMAATQLDTQFTQALASAGLPKTRGTVQRMAQYMYQFAEAGHDVTASEVVPYVLKDYEDEHREMWGNSDLDQLYKQLGEENIKKIIKLHNNKVKSTAETKLTKDAGTIGRTRLNKDKKPTKSFDEVFRELKQAEKKGK